MAHMLHVPKTPRKELTNIQRQQIIEAYCAGTSQQQVSAIFDLSQRQVNYAVNNEASTPRSGRPRKSDPENCLAAWDTVKEELFESLVRSMRDRVEAVINAKWGYTRF